MRSVIGGILVSEKDLEIESSKKAAARFNFISGHGKSLEIEKCRGTLQKNFKVWSESARAAGVRLRVESLALTLVEQGRSEHEGRLP
jgi:hypothetical protein